MAFKKREGEVVTRIFSGLLDITLNSMVFWIGYIRFKYFIYMHIYTHTHIYDTYKI